MWGETKYRSSTPRDYKNDPSLREPDLGDPISPVEMLPLGIGAKAAGGAIAQGLNAFTDMAKAAPRIGFPGALGAGIQKAATQGQQRVAELTAGLAGGASVGGILANTAADIHRQGNRWVEDQRKARAEFETKKELRRYVANNPVDSLDPKLSPDQLSDQLAERLDVPSQYLKDLTRKESRSKTHPQGDPNAKPPINPKTGKPYTSAEGLTQFLDSTWDITLKEAGDRLGYDPHEGDPKPLKRDPRWSIAAGAELAKKNADILKTKIGRRPTQGEVYLAHFMGASGASDMIVARDRGDGSKIAASLYPEAAKANRNVFYDKASGKPRTVDQVIQVQSKGFSDNEF